MMFDQIEASVAPPIAMSLTPGAASFSRCGRSSPIQSPESMARRSGSLLPCASASTSSMSSRMGTVFQTVTPYSRTIRRQSPALRRIASPMATMAAPDESIPKISYTERSKSSEDTARHASPSPTWNRPLMSAIVFRALRCSMATPLGSPVEPEVKMT